ncbi:MAG: phosphate ABC transporter permease PstA [Archaeoglobaceae archaeon]|uniref:Phosphate transport system permease protein PstA n=1 Tax=Archaeoglobus fulgidus TaxID=2234 RepID=A0A7J3M5H2_ARCFL
MFRKLKETLFIAYVCIFSIIALLPLVHIVFTVFANGIPVIFRGGTEFLTQSLASPGKGLGGIFPAIFGTFLLVFLSSLIGIPIAILAGTFIAEYPTSALSKSVRALLTIMLEFPTILVGLFVMAILVIPMGSFSAIAASLALAIVMLPYVATYTEQALRNVPQHYKEGAYALGLRKARVVFSVSMRIARKGVVTGLLIGVAKVSGETAPLIFTAGNAWRSVGGVFEPVGAIPLWIYYLVQQPYANYHEIAWGSAAVLLTLFLVIFIPLRVLTREVRV